MEKKHGLELAERYVAAVGSGDGEQLGELLADDVGYDSFWGARFVGIENFRRQHLGGGQAFDPALGDLVYMASADATRVAIETTMRGRYRESVPDLPQARGQSFSVSMVIVLAIDGDRIGRISEFVNLPELVRQLEKN